MECIICREIKSYAEMSDEHVIPDSLGGYYHIYNVCKSCNSYLGKNVDSKLVNHSFSKFFRRIHNIKGKSGKKPNPFEGEHFLTKKENIKTRLEFNDENKLVPYLLPEVKQIKDNIGVKQFRVSVDSKDEDKLPGIIKKLAKRNNIKNIKLPSDFTKYTNPIDSEVTVKLNIDLEDFRIGLLKIAYEFAVDSIPDYYKDLDATRISESLLSSHIEEEFFVSNGFMDENIEKLLYTLDLKSDKHYLVLLDTKKGLLCIIYLANNLTIIIRLSKKRYSKIPIIGINDLKNKTFYKINLLQLFNKVYYPTEYFLLVRKVKNPILVNQQDFIYNNKKEIAFRNVYELLNTINQKDIKEFKDNNHNLVSEVKIYKDLYLENEDDGRLNKIISLKLIDRFKKPY